jgi:hypothetical protein
VACALHDGRSFSINLIYKEPAMSNSTTFESLSLDQLSSANGGQQAEQTMQAIKGVGQLTGCAREAFDQGVRYGNAGWTTNGGIITQNGNGLSATQRASLGLDACLKGANDAANAQRQLGLP